MKIGIICVGGLKDRWLSEAEKEYAKRLSADCSLSVTELTPAQVEKPGTAAQISSALEAEGAKILEKCSGAYNIALCVEGKQLSSAEFAAEIKRISCLGVSSLNFIIGSSYGLAPEVKNAADMRLSFSKMTFPHRMFRIMLLEQLYRAFDILGPRKYDK